MPQDARAARARRRRLHKREVAHAAKVLRHDALVQDVEHALMYPSTPLSTLSTRAPGGVPYGMDYMDLVDDAGVVQEQVKVMRGKISTVYPALREFAAKHKLHIIVRQGPLRASMR